MRPKARENSKVRLKVDFQSEFRPITIPKGTEGVVVECYSTPKEGYAVDLAIPDERLVGGYQYENVILEPDQFEVIDTEYGQLSPLR
jgi:hypothetical protein